MVWERDYHFTAIVQHFCTHNYGISTTVVLLSVRAEDSLRPLVDYKYNSVWDGVGISLAGQTLARTAEEGLVTLI